MNPKDHWNEAQRRQMDMDRNHSEVYCLIHKSVVNITLDVTERKNSNGPKTNFLWPHINLPSLTAIRWNLELSLIRKNKTSAGRKEKLMRYFESNRLMVKSVNELLDIAHIIQEKLPNYSGKTDLWQLYHHGFLKMRRIAKRQKVVIWPKQNSGFDPWHWNNWNT